LSASLIPIAIAMFLQLLAACGDTNTGQERPDRMSENASTAQLSGVAIAEKIGLRFPANATIEFADYMEGPDDNARLVVTLPATDWETLSAKPPFVGAAYSADNNHHMAPDDARGPWAPEKAANLETAQVPYRDGREALNIGLSRQANGNVRLFLFWYQL
jgi:hypothetical protein